MQTIATARAGVRRSDDSPPLVPALSRALTLLDRLAQHREPMSLARLAAELALPKSSVHGLCSTLVSFGYLRRQDDGAFLIGPRVMSLAEAFVHGTNVAQEFNALWKDAQAEPEETILLSVLDGPDVVYVAARNGTRPLGLAFNVGMRLPAHLAATGRAMLAYHDPEFVRALYPAGLLPRMAGKGPRSVEELLKELAATRRRGHSVDDENVRKGVYCLGAPVFDAAGQPVAGIGVCIHKATRVAASEARHRKAVQQAAGLLTQRLGGEVPEAPAPRAHRTRRDRA